MKTITKLSLFVTVSALAAACLLACSPFGILPAGVRESGPTPDSKNFGPPIVLGNLDTSQISESSGVTASRCQRDVLWTHNDSGGGPFLYAVNLKGKTLGVWRVRNAKERDWEDIASTKEKDGRCYLYVGDIGDNDEKHRTVSVYRIEEPSISEARGNTNKKKAEETASAEQIVINYPDGSHNAETLLIHPQTLSLYIVTKKQSAEAAVFRVPEKDWRRSISSSETVTSERLGSFQVPAIAGGFITGGEISPDGRRVAICDYFNAYEFTLPAGENDFSSVWKQSPVVIDTGVREQGEAVAYSPDGNTLYLTSEKKPGPLIAVKRKN